MSCARAGLYNLSVQASLRPQMRHTKRYDVFLSYAGADEPVVAELARKLQAAGFKPFFAPWSLIPGEPWQEKLEEALDDSATCAVCIGPQGIAPWQNEEMRAALARRVRDAPSRVIPTLLPGADSACLPAFLRRLTWADLRPGLSDENGFRRLISGIEGVPQEPAPGDARKQEETRSPSGVRLPPKLPPHYLERSAYLEPLKRALLAPDSKRLGISGAGMIGVQGMGGIGKTILAAAVARDPEIQAAFEGGVFWVTVGQQPDLAALLRELAVALGDQEAVFTSAFQGKQYVAKLAAQLRILLVLDDIWNLADAEALDIVGPEGRLLLTTRDQEILVRMGAAEVRVEILDTEEALTFLADWAGQNRASLPEVAAKVAKECGYLPLALAMIGAMVRLRPTAWEDALARLQRADLEKIRGQFPDYPYPDLLRALAVSVDALEPWQRDRYLELAVFPEDTAVPEATVVTLWSAAGVPEEDARDLIGTLFSRSLATRDASGHLTLHDLQGDYLRKRAGDLRPLHGRLVEAYAARCADGFPSGPDDGYFFQSLPHHLAAAGLTEEVKGLFFDFRWLAAKLRATDVNTLMADYEHLPEVPEARLVQGALRLAAHVLARDPAQLAGQLQGRLAAHDLPQLARLLAATTALPTASLRPIRPTLITPGGALFRVLKGHTDWVHAVARLDEHRVVSASSDRTLRVWDVASGATLATLEGHTGVVHAVARLDERRVISASWDRTLRVWDVASGATLATLEGHTDWVNAVARLDGHRVVSASSDRTLRVWDVASGATLTTLEGHTNQVNAVARLDEHRVVSASNDCTLRIWDVASGATLATLEGHTDWVWAVARLDERRVVSASNDRTLRVWDVASGATLATLEGHTDWVWAVARLDERRVVSGSFDGTLRVWDVASGGTLATLEGHPSAATAVARLDERRMVSGSMYGTLRVWDLARGATFVTLEGRTGSINAVARLDERRVVSASSALRVWDIASGATLATLEGHTDYVWAVARLDDRRVVSASRDGTLRVWDVVSGATLATLEGHTDWVHAVARLDERRVISGSLDSTLRVWDVASGATLATLEGHTSSVNAVARLDERRVVSASEDRTLRVWDVASGATLTTLEGHTNQVNAVARLDEHRVVSASNDCTLRVWDVASGATLATLEGHTDVVIAVARLDERRVVSASVDGTVRVWDVETGSSVATFTLDAPATAVDVIPEQKLVVAGDSSGRLHYLAFEEPAA